MTRALRIAIVGAESTGKSTLAPLLAARVADEYGLRAIHVPEVLRAWCDERGRTPLESEQEGIAREQQARIDAAAATADVVVCDTAPLMIAVYSRTVFGDPSLEPLARAAHADIAFTLLTALDLPWIADGLQRDGPHVRAPVDALIRQHLLAWRSAWAVVGGTGAARAEQAMEALRPTLAGWSRGGEAPRTLFSAMLATGVGPRRLGPAMCERCDVTMTPDRDADCGH